MIISKLNGGLGNQMFQYAAGRAMACKHKTDLVLDLSWFKNIPTGNTSRKFELDKFSICARMASAKEESLFVYYQNKWLRRLPFLHKPWELKIEKHFHYDHLFLNFPDNSYLDGYWQSYLYFDHISDKIKLELTSNMPLGELNEELFENIITHNSVALHVRRGDYLTNTSAANYHGVCSLLYYQKAIDLLSSQYSNLYFYVFSDDIKWAESNLTIPFPTTFIGHNFGDQSFQDLRLISRCKHQIIANSSFSWWGAWLNSYENKTVIAPKKWFLNNKKTESLFPPSWQLL